MLRGGGWHKWWFVLAVTAPRMDMTFTDGFVGASEMLIDGSRLNIPSPASIFFSFPRTGVAAWKLYRYCTPRTTLVKEIHSTHCTTLAKGFLSSRQKRSAPS
ncbi:unnamed protein product [Ascophyllum nodosum]